MKDSNRDFKEEERYIEEESPELTVGENLTWGKRIMSAFPALQSRNYQLYFSGQLISLIGTWLQIVAQGWLVLQLTHSAFWVGLVTGVGALPTLFLTLFGGVIVDRFSKKNIILFTQSAAMILAFILGGLTVVNVITVWHIAILSFLLGIVNALDAPARQAYAPELVGRESLASAIALNSGVFNAARVIGPGVAGILIAWVGTGGAFILNGVSYIAVIIALLFITTPALVERKHLHPIAAIKEGLIYSFTHPLIRSILIFAAVVSIFGWSYMTILPVVAQNTFHMDATGLGYLYAAGGLGALLSTFVVSAWGNKFSPNTFIIGGNILFAVFLFLFTFTKSVPFALLFMFLSGFGLLAQFAMMNTTVQHVVSDTLRGRVMSVYTLMFIGFLPIGNFEIGIVAQYFGTEFAIRLGAIVVLAFGLLMYGNRNKVRAALACYHEERS